MKKFVLVSLLSAVIGIIPMSVLLMEDFLMPGAKGDKCSMIGTMCADQATFYVTLFSTIFFAASVGFLIWGVFIQNKSRQTQIEQLKSDSYGRLRDNHHDLTRLLVEKPELYKIFTKTKIDSTKYNKKHIELLGEDQMIFHYYLAEFELCERIYYSSQYEELENDLINSYEWITWLIFLELISHHWLFAHTYNVTRTTFGPEFMDQIKTNIIDGILNGEDVAKNLEELAKGEYYKNYTEAGRKKHGREIREKREEEKCKERNPENKLKLPPLVNVHEYPPA